MNAFLVKFLFSVSVFLSFNSFSQALPPINTFSTKDYGGENQNWDISQAENKYIYIANNKGLLEYNGANWQLYSTPNETIMRSVKVLGDKVFTGFYMGFGYWQKNNFGVLEFSSIVKEQNIQMLEDEQIWTILELDGWVLFKSLERIYLYNIETQLVKSIEAENRIENMSKIDGVIYFQEMNKGVFKIENGFPVLISDDKILRNNVLASIFKKEDKLLFLTQEKGFFFLNDNELEKWNISTNNLLNGKTIYSAKELRNQDYVLGTISDGLVYITKDGVFKNQITQGSGLSNNTVLSIFEDQKNNIWLGLDTGINCVNNASPFKIFTQKNEFWGTIYTTIVYDGYLYVGTNQGLFCWEINSKKPFIFIENTQGQVWNLVNIDNTLFCGHNKGTFIIKKDKAERIVNIRGTWDIRKKDDNTIIQGNYDGLYVLKKQNSKWKLKNKIEGFNNSSRFFLLLEDDKVFVNHEYKGVFKLTIDEEYKKIISVIKDTTITKSIHSSLILYNNNVLYASKNGVFKFSKTKNSFKKDTVYSKLISNENYSSARLVYDFQKNQLWSFSNESIKYLVPGKLSSEPTVKTISISESIPKAASGYENIIHLKNGKYLLGTSNGYLEIDINSLKEPKDFNIHLNYANCFITDEPKKEVNLSIKKRLNYKENNIEFSYSVPNFNKIATTKYQYQLQGHSKYWSTPSKSTKILFENLPSGNYTFKVRGIIAGKLSKNEAIYNFKINKAWYVSNVLVVIYALLFMLLFYVLHIWSKKYYKKQREKLIDKAQKELEIKELESSKKIIKLNNEKLKNNIASKNRELATSTMSIIKKNEFLGSIKKELLEGKEKSIDKVIKIIDKNITNTDDWKMFQEAFNNADKKFLKKIKSKHPDLTPNDLRLCAYLRLNLSSKEIAPLLNISPRSVEVKRYRLRKKMNLDHNENLTNYILEI